MSKGYEGSPSKYSPSAHTNFFLRSCHCLKHVWKSYFVNNLMRFVAPSSVLVTKVSSSGSSVPLFLDRIHKHTTHVQDQDLSVTASRWIFQVIISLFSPLGQSCREPILNQHSQRGELKTFRSRVRQTIEYHQVITKIRLNKNKKISFSSGRKLKIRT